jgi:hypothetical protein
MHFCSKTFIATSILAALSACSHEGGGSGTLLVPVNNASSAGGESLINESAAGKTQSGAKTQPTIKTEPAGRMDFSWQSGSNASQGSIAASSSDGRTFTGTFLQPTRAMTINDYGPYWSAWAGGWGGAGPWYNGAEADFITTYSGHVLASLTGNDGTRMRCTFMLRDPSNGMAGGGEGDCQLSNNEKVFHAVLIEP